MKRHQWFVVLGLVFSLLVHLGFAKEDGAKLERVAITQLDVEAMTLTVADMTFWVDTKTKIEDSNSNPISLSNLSVGDNIEIWYDESRSNDDGFSYASKIELEG